MKTPLCTSTLMRALELVLLPSVCCLCGLEALGNGLDLCAVCKDSLPAAAGVVGADPETFARRFDRFVIPYVYRYPVDHFVRALKFHGERRYARVLGTLIAQAQSVSSASVPDALVPMPLHLTRLRQRGFNQAHELARYAGALLNVPVLGGVLVRKRSTTEQSRLDLTRRHLNVLGAFGLSGRLPTDATIALVDDVVTTGSTSAEAAFCLRENGARRVELWAAAYALTRRSLPLRQPGRGS